MLESFFRLDDKVAIKNFVPEIYTDRIYETKENKKEISDSDYAKNGIYRFYGIFSETNQMVGYIKYHILFNSPTIEIDRIEIDPLYRGKGYGTALMNQSLLDLTTDFPFIGSINVCSTTNAIPFYRKNDFIPYFGDNNLMRILRKNDN